MKKSSIKDTLIERASLPSSRIIFLRKKQEIIDALKAGFTRKEIYQILQEGTPLSFTYKTFCKWVNRYLLPQDRELDLSRSEAAICESQQEPTRDDDDPVYYHELR